MDEIKKISERLKELEQRAKDSEKQIRLLKGSLDEVDELKELIVKLEDRLDRKQGKMLSLLETVDGFIGAFRVMQNEHNKVHIDEILDAADYTLKYGYGNENN